MILLIAALLAADPAASAVAPSPVDEAQANYDRVEQIYTQSCADRSYAAYDDLCDQLKSQVHAYRVQLDRAQRTTPPKQVQAPAPPKP